MRRNIFNQTKKRHFDFGKMGGYDHFVKSDLPKKTRRFKRDRTRLNAQRVLNEFKRYGFKRL